MLSNVVMNTDLRHPGQPGAVPAAAVPPVAYDVPSIVLALRTLGSFNFDGNIYILLIYFYMLND